MRPLALLVLVCALLAGCVEAGTYRLAVANAGTTTATIALEVFQGSVSDGPVAGHTFEAVPPNETYHVDVDLRPARTYRLEAHTLDLSERAQLDFRAQRGTWWLTAFVEADGRLTLEAIREA